MTDAFTKRKLNALLRNQVHLASMIQILSLQMQYPERALSCTARLEKRAKLIDETVKQLEGEENADAKREASSG